VADRVNQRAERRASPSHGHSLRVSVLDGALQVVCSCGATLTGKRHEDTTMMTLSDLLELVRIHSADLNSRR
jgi:hypothetical protein